MLKGVVILMGTQPLPPVINKTKPYWQNHPPATTVLVFLLGCHLKKEFPFNSELNRMFF